MLGKFGSRNEGKKKKKKKGNEERILVENCELLLSGW
jgi:hypothetical protein